MSRPSRVFGYQATHYKLAVWTISAMMAGLAGGLFGSWTTFVDPNSFILLESMLLVSIVILGGLATIWGVAAGGDSLRAAGGGDAVHSLPAHGVRRAVAAGGAGGAAGVADAVQAAGLGGEVQAMSAEWGNPHPNPPPQGEGIEENPAPRGEGTGETATGSFDYLSESGFTGLKDLQDFSIIRCMGGC